MPGQPFTEAIPIRALTDLKIRDHHIEIFFFKQSFGCRQISCGMDTVGSSPKDRPNGFQDRLIAINQQNPTMLSRQARVEHQKFE